MTKIHTEPVRDYRGPIAKLLERIRHRHYTVKRTWTLDGSSWLSDPNAFDHCECGARRHIMTDWWIAP